MRSSGRSFKLLRERKKGAKIKFLYHYKIQVANQRPHRQEEKKKAGLDKALFLLHSDGLCLIKITIKTRG